MAPDQLIDLEVGFTAQAPGSLSTVLEIQVQGGRTIKLPFRAEGVIPVVEVEQVRAGTNARDRSVFVS